MKKTYNNSSNKYTIMEKKTLKKLVFLLVTSLCIFSCDENFLEEANPVELSTSSFWLNINDLETGLISVYNAFKDGNVLNKTNELNRSDMTFPGWGRPNTSNVYWLQTFNNSSGAPNTKWAALYKGIFRANQVLEAAERLYPTFEGETKDRADLVIAQARTFRGLFYFYLYTGFNNGAVPIIDYVPTDISNYYQPISPAETVQAFYLSDLEYGAENLPMTYDGPKGRLTSGTAIALLGKSYLYDGDYTMAAQYFKTIIDDHPYALTPDIGSNFTTRDEFNEESILEIGYSVNYKEEFSVWGQEQNSSTLNFSFAPAGTPGGWRSVYPACWLNNLYRNEVLDMTDPRNTVSRIQRQANGLPVLDGDGNPVMDVDVPRIFSLRTSASIAFCDDEDTDYYLLTSAQGAPYNNAEHSYWRKFTNWDIAASERDIAATIPRSGINIRVIRLADIYLMYAEALIGGGTNNAGVEEALVYINRVRRRSGVRLLGLTGTGEYPVNDHDEITYDASSLMDHLMYVERPLELSAEGNAIRTIDLRRWGITKQRFEELSQKQYWSTNYPFETEDGTSGTRWAGILSDVGTGDPNGKWTEFEQAAANYVEELHAYWPVPNSEETSNPVLYDTP
ncbi:RagB/SusD family nutrient uptake outer membrane protein [Seonamhaeicola sp.]|uniref:RagB/SusD family nutrient uptake outer membrane protein n=1 Tax=Seonamhaeicola sp. TaxID=1912245 RepID=UPI00262939D6|nr:RagB/SusD family nutrient uptake outer membrane protein [Seonamhaeicola sp.]